MTYSFLERNNIPQDASEYTNVNVAYDEKWPKWLSGAFSTGQQAVKGAHEYLNKLINPLEFQGSDLNHIDSNRPAGPTIKISTWTFSVDLKYTDIRPNARAKFPFQVEVVSDGVNIFKAFLTPQAHSINTLSAANKPDILKLTAVPRPNAFTKNGVQYKSFDVQGTWTVKGIKYGPKVYVVNFEVIIGVDGSVSARITGQTDRAFVNLTFPTKLNNEKTIQVGSRPDVVTPYNPNDPRNKVSIDYATNKRAISRDGYIELAAWWENLPKSSLTALKKGQASIHIKSYTDTVGSSEANLSLSKQRAIRAHYYMSRFIGKIKFKAYIMHPAGLGETPARNAGLRNNQSSSDWRRTDIFIK